jgi:hypothetical protein
MADGDRRHDRVLLPKAVKAVDDSRFDQTFDYAAEDAFLTRSTVKSG